MLALLFTVGLVATACAENDTATDGDTTTTAAAAEPETAEPEAEPEEAEPEEAEPEDEVMTEEDPEEAAPAELSAEDQWALDYIGGQAGVDVTGDPVRIGFANTSDFFPSADIAADEAANYVNEVLQTPPHAALSLPTTTR